MCVIAFDTLWICTFNPVKTIFSSSPLSILAPTKTHLLSTKGCVFVYSLRKRWYIINTQSVLYLISPSGLYIITPKVCIILSQWWYTSLCLDDIRRFAPIIYNGSAVDKRFTLRAWCLLRHWCAPAAREGGRTHLITATKRSIITFAACGKYITCPSGQS